MKKDTKEKLIAFRVPSEWSEALQRLSQTVGLSQQRIGEDTFALLLGCQDEVRQQRHEMVVKAVKKGKVKLPFEHPLTPVISSAAFASVMN